MPAPDTRRAPPARPFRTSPSRGLACGAMSRTKSVDEVGPDGPNERKKEASLGAERDRKTSFFFSEVSWIRWILSFRPFCFAMSTVHPSPSSPHLRWPCRLRCFSTASCKRCVTSAVSPLRGETTRNGAMTTGWCPIFSMYLGKGVQDSQDVSRYLLFFWGVMSHFQRYFAGSRPLLTSLWKQRRLQLGRLRHTQLS